MITTLTDRPNTALIVIDVQNGVVTGAFRRDEVVSNIASLVDRARAEGVPVIWVQHSDPGLPEGSVEWQLVSELEPVESEALVLKRYGDAFEGTVLEEVLATAGVGAIVVAGAETDVCIRSTIHGGFARGYDVTLVGDAHTAVDKTEWGAPSVEAVIGHTNLYWGFQGGPGKTASVVDTGDVRFGG